jgi:hypothetical protein
LFVVALDCLFFLDVLDELVYLEVGVLGLSLEEDILVDIGDSSEGAFPLQENVLGELERDSQMVVLQVFLVQNGRHEVLHLAIVILYFLTLDGLLVASVSILQVHFGPSLPYSHLHTFPHRLIDLLQVVSLLSVYINEVPQFRTNLSQVIQHCCIMVFS